MVDVGAKSSTVRRAVGRSVLRARPETVAAVRDLAVGKGDVLSVARVAGIMAAKRTSELIPLCHPIPLTSVDLDIDVQEGEEIVVTAIVTCTGKTGVEMEALTAVSVAALTVYDMCKSIDRGMTIVETSLLEKSGGRSGVWRRNTEPKADPGTK